MTDAPSKQPAFHEAIPEGDDHVRRICTSCGFIDYQNPKIVVGSVALWDGKILLCRRAIEPRTGFWTLPAGFLEIGESVEDGARREAYEEARVDLEIERVLAIYSAPRISQVQIMFRAHMRGPDFAPGHESLETNLFEWGDIPWTDLAFPTVGWALRHYDDSRGQTDFPPYSNPIDGL